MPLRPQPWMDSPASKRLFAAIEAAGGELRFVGGCVRDALLERVVYDIDAACTLPPEQVMQALEQVDIRAIPTGIAHGTVTAICDGQRYEITTLRRDVDCDGRHAEVAYTDDWQEDAARRDFTMNALYATPDVTLYDYFGGEADATAGHVRFIGDAAQRIREDGLRILRFFRFYAHYGQGAPDAKALAACTREVAMLDALSGERIQSEMRKLLAAPAPQAASAAMESCGVLPHINLPKPAECRQTQLIAHEPEPDPIRRLAAWLRSDPDMLEPLLQRWKFSNADKARLRAIVPPRDGVEHWSEAEQKAVMRREGKERFVDVLLLAWAEQPERAAALKAMLELAEQWQIPDFPVTGHDLMQLGIGEGRALGQMLHALEVWWEAQGYAPDKAAVLDEAKRRMA